MDIVEYNGARVRLMKVNQQMSSWKLLVLLWLISSWSELADANDPSENVTRCRGDDAWITWAHKVPPFIVIEWYFNDTLIAQTYNESLSQDNLIIKENYIDRFRLIRTDNVGFKIKDVKQTDSGEYKCIVTLQETGAVYIWKKSLKYIGPDCHRSRTELDTGEQHCYCIVEEGGQSPKSGEEEQPPASDDSPGTTNHVAVAVPVVISVIAVIAVIAAIVAFVVIRKKRKSLGENQNVRFEAENGEESEDLMENKKA